MLEHTPIICIVGPTASGKTALSQQVALKYDGEVVSADSMQVYRGMDIGTGKVAPSEKLVAHHCIDIVDPGEPFSAALFQAIARRSFLDIESRGKRSVLCGGTGFYVRAAIDDYDFPKGEQIGNETRDRYNEFARENGCKKLWALLNERDPESAAIIPINDTKRIVRAFELLESDTSYAKQKEKLASIPQLYPAVFIGLSVDPAILSKRIEMRVEKMVEDGLVEEVKSLLDSGFREGITSPQAIGYKEIVSYLDGDCSLDEALDSIKLSTRRYAKRQRTWFRKDKRIHWIDADALDLDAMLKASIDIIGESI
jgi:tRNA dimethylallyltransferase